VEYYLGVDSGGTKTTSIIIDSFGKIIGTGIAGSTDLVNAGKKRAYSELSKSVDMAISNSEISKEKIVFSCFAMSGYGDVIGIETDLKTLIDRVIASNKIIINDVRAALEGACPLRSAAILLAGTGAMAMAKDDSENVYRTDGWGEQLGDLGSGFYIGRRGLQEVFKAYDGRDLAGIKLLKIAQNEFIDGNDLRIIIDKCKGSNTRSYIASFGRFVDTAANKNDALAKQILIDAAKELFISLRAVTKNISSRSIRISTVGSVFKSKILSDEIRRLIDTEERFIFKDSEFSPEVGAVIMAYRKCNAEKSIYTFVDNLEKNYVQ